MNFRGLDGTSAVIYCARLAESRSFSTNPPRADGGQWKGLFVNVTVQNLAPCKKLVRVEVEADKVNEAFASVTKDYRKHANLPGFRPGKAPEAMVVRKLPEGHPRRGKMCRENVEE